MSIREVHYYDPINDVYSVEYEEEEDPEEELEYQRDQQQREEESQERERLEGEGEGEGSQTPEGSLVPKTPPTPPATPDPLAKLKLATQILADVPTMQAKRVEKIRYCWGVAVVQGTIAMFAGGPGCGKSTLLFLLVAARLSPVPIEVLGMPVSPASKKQYVILIEGEHGECSTARKLFRALDTFDLPDSCLSQMVIIARKAVTVGDRAWKAIEELVGLGLVADIFLDTLARVSGNADPNDEREQVKLFDRLAKTIELAPTTKTQPTIWLAAHTRKVDTKPTLNDVSGSAQRTGQCDSLFGVFGSGQNPRTLCFLKLREEPDIFPQNIRYTYIRGELVVIPLKSKKGKEENGKETSPQVPKTGIPDLIVAAIRSTPQKRWTQSALRRALPTTSPQKIVQALESLCKVGTLELKEDLGMTLYSLKSSN